jgi:SnoaL-like domain
MCFAGVDVGASLSRPRDTARTMPEEPTTPDLVELTRRMFEVPGGTPWSQEAVVATFTAFFAPDVVWESVGLGTTFSGLQASREFLGDWMARFGDYEIDIEEILDLGGGVVFVKSGHAGRPIGSPAHVRLPREVLVNVFAWEARLIAHVVSSGDTPEARAAAERLAQEGA